MIRHKDIHQALDSLKLEVGQEFDWYQTLYSTLTSNGIFIPPWNTIC